MEREDVWDGIFGVPAAYRNFDEDRPWLGNPRAQEVEGRELQVATFTSSLLLALGECGGMASLRAWNLQDRSDRELLRQYVAEMGQLLATLRLGLSEYENDDEREG